MAEQPVGDDNGRSPGLDEGWDSLGVGVGRLLGALADLDRVSFEVDEDVVLAVTRDADDLWVLATGPEDTVGPLDLTNEQKETLRSLGFDPPLGDGVECAPQRETWWLHLRLPAELSTLESAGHRVVAAARYVYHAQRPTDIVWFGMGLTAGVRRVLDSLGMTRSPFQRG